MTAKQSPRRDTGGQTGAGSGTSGTTVAHDLAAWRCWTWRNRHGCRCGRPADCLLYDPLPVHLLQPCPGEFGAGGKWKPCCRAAS
jgi:hypothetical protein